MPTIHEPVLLKEVLDLLRPQPGETFIDGTFGGGGHSLALVEKVKPNGKVIGIDWDPRALTDSSNANLILINDNYRNLKKIYADCREKFGLNEINGILLDLGLSSDQLADEERGFSFAAGRLDMRFNAEKTELTAADILTTYSEGELIKILEDFGGEPLAKPIAKAIISRRNSGEDIGSADVLVRLIEDVYRRRFRGPSKKNPATRTLQALRIAVNDEFGNIKGVLPQALEVLAVGGRLAVISFHSGEDRMIKNYFRELAHVDDPRLKIITKKPIIASEQEVKINPRSRSAKLRVAEKIR